jgi:hypoxanthine phosphoribosyltransferase
MILNSKVCYSWKDIETSIKDIHEQILYTKWTPDIIIGIANGGSIPATMFSKLSKIPCKIITVQMRDGKIKEDLDLDIIYKTYGKNILIVDEINDSGETLQWILNNWDITPSQWLCNIRIATLTYNSGSAIKSDFYHWKIDKRIDPVWCVYPWESFVDSDTI